MRNKTAEAFGQIQRFKLREKGQREYVRKTRDENPWHNVYVAKSERKGKTSEELQALRKSIWENS